MNPGVTSSSEEFSCEKTGFEPRSSGVVRIGTRGSPLALAQAEMVRNLLIAAYPALAEPGAIELIVIRTSGDRIQDRALAEIGGKGLFTKEIEEALLDGHIDMAVHSLKDVPTWMPEGLDIVCVLPREDPRDALFSAGGGGLENLPREAVVGTSGLRRQAQVLSVRPDVKVVPLRGNVETRLRKLANGEVDATLLAVAGLRRLGMQDRIQRVLEMDEMLPAVAQGAVGVECRVEDIETRMLLTPLHCQMTAACVAAERAVLAELDGSCRTPIAAHARFDDEFRLELMALVGSPDGRRLFRTARRGLTPVVVARAAEAAGAAPETFDSALTIEAAALGADAGHELKEMLPPGFLAT
ncbi:Porphobilinogen deaminase [Azospirillaceae bacterium]